MPRGPAVDEWASAPGTPAEEEVADWVDRLARYELTTLYLLLFQWPMTRRAWRASMRRSVV